MVGGYSPGLAGARMKLTRPEHAPLPTPRDILEHLDRHVIGQQDAKRAIALAAYAHMRRAEAVRRGYDGLWRKSNILLIGPTGSGKTLLAQHLAGVLRAPITVADATEYTEAGYYGKDVELMITDLYLRAGHSVEDTQRGVVFIDEVDKLARRSQGAQNGAGARDIGGEGVQQALLKLLEGREVQVPAGAGQPWSRQESVVIDTTGILFVCAGTFTDLYGDLETRRPIGFDSGRGTGQRERRRIETKDLVAYGMLTEFLGRLPVVVELRSLTAHELERILVEPEDAVVKEFRSRLALDGVDLVVRQSAVREIVRYALARQVGARGLRAILEEVCADVLFEAPELGSRKVVVDAAYVRRQLKRAQTTREVDARA